MYFLIVLNFNLDFGNENHDVNINKEIGPCLKEVSSAPISGIDGMKKKVSFLHL